MRRPGNPHREQGQAGTRFPSGNGRRPVFLLFGGRVPGRLLERAGNVAPREMVARRQNAAYRLAWGIFLFKNLVIMIEKALMILPMQRVLD